MRADEVRSVLAGAGPADLVVPLRVGEQLSRDARARVIAASAVVLVHSSYPPGSLVLASAEPLVQGFESAAFDLLVSFPVNTFIMLSFLGLASRLAVGLSGAQVLRAAAARLLPAHVFWSVAFLAARALANHEVPSGRALLEGIVLGRAAAHLYFTPQLLALTAASPIFDRLARTPSLAIASGALLGTTSITMHAGLPSTDAWVNFAVGFLGLAPFAVAGLALARWWNGIAPGPERGQQAVRLALPMVMVSAIVVVRSAWSARGTDLVPSPSFWLANNALALGVPVLLLTFASRVSPRIIRLAPYTLGVYLVHPFFVQALRAAEARFHPLAASAWALVVPNAAVALVLSFVAVMAIARSPLRRMVI